MRVNIPLSILAAAMAPARLTGKSDVMITSLATDSRHVQPGGLFACVRGLHVDGHEFAADAVAKGAVALLTDRLVRGVDLNAVGVLRVADVAKTLKTWVDRFYNHPSRRMRLAGVTGTNGKTTFTHLLRAILERQGSVNRAAYRVGLMGTIAHEYAGKKIPAGNTTPMAWDIQRMLADMADHQCQAVVMEVSSHALAEDRVAGCEFDVGVFTNLTPEHLDYHPTMAAYGAAKQKLFRLLGRHSEKDRPKTAVINRDDPYAGKMIRAAGKVKVLTYGLKPGADVTAQKVILGPSGTRFVLKSPAGQTMVRLRLPGRFNVANALAAAAAGLALEVPLATIKRGLESIASVSGRMEMVPGPQPFAVVVDYAHTPDALKNVLISVREFTRGRVLLVFGCGGDRDKSKRAPMGRLAIEMADIVVVTSDNPRSEDPARIIGQIVGGCRQVPQGRIRARIVDTEPDRPRAIRKAVAMAKPGDTVLIAGKGHEHYQILGDRTIACDDRLLARMAIRQESRRKAWKE